MMRNHQTAAEHDFRNAVSDVEDMLDSAGERGHQGAREMQERALRALDDVKERLASLDSQVRRSARHAAEATDDYVREQPWRAIGLGATAGILLGLAAAMMVSRRR